MGQLEAYLETIRGARNFSKNVDPSPFEWNGSLFGYNYVNENRDGDAQKSISTQNIDVTEQATLARIGLRTKYIGIISCAFSMPGA
jgi:hypothetical protein